MQDFLPFRVLFITFHASDKLARQLVRLTWPKRKKDASGYYVPKVAHAQNSTIPYVMFTIVYTILSKYLYITNLTYSYNKEFIFLFVIFPFIRIFL